MSIEDENELNYPSDLPAEVFTAYKMLIALATLNFSGIEDEVEYAKTRELIIDEIYPTGMMPLVKTDNTVINGHTLFNSALILITEILVHACDEDVDKIQHVLQEAGLLVVNS
jgi:hypothetical protein